MYAHSKIGTMILKGEWPHVVAEAKSRGVDVTDDKVLLSVANSLTMMDNVSKMGRTMMKDELPRTCRRCSC